MVKVEAGCVMVTGTVVVTTPAEVLDDGLPGYTVITDTTPVDMLTTVCAGEDVVIVTTFALGELDEGLDLGLIVVVITLPPCVIVEVIGGDCDTVCVLG